MAQFVLVNVVVAVLMKKLDVNIDEQVFILIVLFFFKESNRMLADDAEIDEEIERQLDADAHDRNYLKQPLLEDERDLDVSRLVFFNIFLRTVLVSYGGEYSSLSID